MKIVEVHSLWCFKGGITLIGLIRLIDFFIAALKIDERHHTRNKIDKSIETTLLYITTLYILQYCVYVTIYILQLHTTKSNSILEVFREIQATDCTTPANSIQLKSYCTIHTCVCPVSLIISRAAQNIC